MSISLCYLQIELESMSRNDDESKLHAGAISADFPTLSTKKYHDQRKPKTITIDNFTNSHLSGEPIRHGVLPSGSREVTPLNEPLNAASITPELMDPKSFFSGNPFVEVTKGIIHLYKKNERIEVKQGVSKTICLLAVPATLNCHDLLNYVSPCHPVLQHIRIIRDGTPNQFMVILEFRSLESAMEFYQTYNGAPYNSLEPSSLCHAVWVSSVDWGYDGDVPVGHTELPTCPVCLERMDESVDGVLTILCNHAFHANCLVKWGDSTCPVCRCVQTPELTESSVCMECEGAENLWICLICGHVGCGRYQGGHAATHYRSSNHTYALQLGTNRVWDYAGDNFVHRLLENNSDGKLVASQTPGNKDDEKVDSLQLEFTHLLTTQLDTQRQYFDEKLERLECKFINEFDKLFEEKSQLLEKCNELRTHVMGLSKEKSGLEKKVNVLSTKLSALNKEMIEEREMNKALQSNQTSWNTKFTQLEAKHKQYQSDKQTEIIDLNDQIRDLQFFIEAQSMLSKSEYKDELGTASVVVPPPEPSAIQKNRRRKKK